MRRLLALLSAPLASLLLAALLAGCAPLTPGAAGGGGEDVVEGVYVGRFNQQFESTELVIELRQSGRRLSGTYTLRVGGTIQEGRVTGLYTAPTVELEFPNPDRSATFVGTASADGAVIEGQFDAGGGANYAVTLRRD